VLHGRGPDVTIEFAKPEDFWIPFVIGAVVLVWLVIAHACKREEARDARLALEELGLVVPALTKAFPYREDVGSVFQITDDSRIGVQSVLAYRKLRRARGERLEGIAELKRVELVLKGGADQ
jgi:hypothetical protein